MRTTLTIEDDVAIRLERVRKERSITLKALVNDALRRGLEQMEAPLEPRERYRIKPFDLGKCALTNVDNIVEVLAFAEGEDFR